MCMRWPVHRGSRHLTLRWGPQAVAAVLEAGLRTCVHTKWPGVHEVQGRSIAPSFRPAMARSRFSGGAERWRPAAVPLLSPESARAHALASVPTRSTCERALCAKGRSPRRRSMVAAWA